MVNPLYLQNKEQIKDIFEKQGIVILFDFLNKDNFTKLQHKATSLPFKQDTTLLTHSFSTATLSSPLDTSTRAFLYYITNTTLPKQAHLLQFKHKDYTILSDLNPPEPMFDIILTLTSNWNPKWGGTIHYVDGIGNYQQVPPKANLLVIAKRDHTRKRFIKYVNCKAAGNSVKYLLLSQ